MPERKEFLKVDKTHGLIRFGIRILSFKDNDYFIAYAPSLNLSSYGETKEEAKSMLDTVLTDFCEQLLRLPQKEIDAELKKLNWKRSRFYNKRFEKSDAFVDKEGILKNFDLSATTHVNEEFMMA